MKNIVLLLMLLVHSALYAAPMDQFEFDTPEQEAVFHKLSQELRCLVCQNQAIAESDAGLAKDLRTEIHKMLKEGKAEKEITDFMVQRYGDFVLYDPPFKPSTWLLWFGPVIAFIFGMFYAVRFFRSQKAVEDAGELSSDEVERLRSLQSELDASGKGDSK